AGLAARRRSPRHQRSSVRHRRVGPRQLAHPVWRPGARAGGSEQGLVFCRLSPGDRRGGLADTARGAFHLVDAQHPPGSFGRRADHQRADHPRLRSADRKAAVEPQAEFRGGRRQPRGGTYIPSPILYRGILYTCNNNGVLTAYRAETGEQLSMIRVSAAGASFAASPVAADGRLYIASETGEVYVLRAGPEPELLGVRPMGEIVMSTPAISGGLMVVRTLNHVFGLAEGAAAPKTGAP